MNIIEKLNEFKKATKKLKHKYLDRKCMALRNEITEELKAKHGLFLKALFTSGIVRIVCFQGDEVVLYGASNFSIEDGVGIFLQSKDIVDIMYEEHEEVVDDLETQYFHNYEYRHLLRGPGHFADFKNLKRVPTVKWWNRKYNEIFLAFQKAGLPPSGFSMAHTKIIEKVLNFKSELLMRAYHHESL